MGVAALPGRAGAAVGVKISNWARPTDVSASVKSASSVGVGVPAVAPSDGASWLGLAGYSFSFVVNARGSDQPDGSRAFTARARQV